MTFVEPLIATVPTLLSEAAVAFCEVQMSVDESPCATLVGFAEIVHVAGGIGLIAICCDAQFLGLFPPLIDDDLLPTVPVVVCTISSRDIDGPNGVFETSYFSVIPVGVLK
jgi:hypothetical protein